MVLDSIEERLRAVERRIEDACRRSGRDPAEVRLIGVTKGRPASAIHAAVAAGLGDLGENYVQELEAKHDAAPSATWHFIGRVQANKARRVAALADVVQTLEPGRAAIKIGAAATESGRSLDGLIEVDFTGRRIGASPDEVEMLLRSLEDEAPALRIRGLMTVAPPAEDPRPSFTALRQLRDQLRERVPELTELSMGMTADLEPAVEEGATMVRVGTAIFGPRP